MVAGVTKYTVSGLATGNSYSFRVRAYTQVSTSEYSNALKIGYLPSAVGLLRTINTPYSLKQVAISRDGAFLLWQGTNCLPLISSWSGTEVSRWNVAPFSSFAVQATDSLIAASGSVGVFRWAWSQSGDRSSMIGYSNCNLCGFSRGGSVLAGTSPSGVTLWVFPPGTQSRTLPLDSALAAAFSPDGSLVAGISRSVIRVWSVASGSPVFSIPTPGTGNSAITFAVDGGRFYSGGTDGWIRAWDGATGSAQGAWDVSAPVTSLVVRPDGMTILSSGETTGAIREWDVSDGSLIQTLEGSGSRVTCLTSGLGGRLLAAVSADAKAHLWSFGGHWWVAP